MEKSESSQMNLEETESPQRSEINSHIKQFETLKKSVEKSNKEIQHWKNQKSKLLESNNNIEANFDMLSRQVLDMEEKLSENMRIHIAKKQEVKDLQNMRANTSNKQWKDCLSGIGKYAEDFCQWITNYSRHVLMKDIESHQKECRKVGNELAILKQQLDDLTRDCDVDYVEANVDDNDLSNLNNIISDARSGNSNLMRNIKLEEDTLNKIEDKIKRSKVALDEFKAKEKTNLQ
ncbi:uncharacterized protein LOC105192978 [Solenopsis invicta]|uniref:uncharacterized protein LOC105192978 n=1 Tax=Solenopsis invicta TaxID=13686 RepID=UPI000595D306|nr:uncharacterized protein LOC105192978 [Solenopsis invicta]